MKIVMTGIWLHYESEQIINSTGFGIERYREYFHTYILIFNTDTILYALYLVRHSKTTT